MRDQSISPVFSGLIVVAVLCGRAPAQSSWPPQEIAWIGVSGQGSFSRACAGDFDGDGFPEAAFLRGSKIVLGVTPGSNPWSLPSDFTANDVATLSVTSGQDAPVFVNSAGLYQGALSSSGVFTTSALAQGAWAGAVLVEAGETLVSGQPKDVIVGVMSDRRTLRRLQSTSEGWANLQISLSPALQSDAQEIALCDLDGDQVLEVVIAAGGTLKIHALTGSLVASYSHSGYTTTGLTVGHMDDGAEWFAWTSVSGGTDYVMAYDEDGLSSLCSLGSVGVFSVASAEWTSDGHSDLVLGVDESNGEYRVLTNLGSTSPSFSGDTYTAIEIAGTQAGTSQVAVADIDTDGDEDLLCPVAGTSSAALCRNAFKDHHELEPNITDFGEDLGDLQAISHLECQLLVEMEPPQVNPYYTLRIRVAPPPPTSPAAEATHVAYAAWKQADSGGSPSQWQTNPVAVFTQQMTEFEGENHVDIDIRLSDPETLGCEEAGVTTTHIYYVELQLQWRSGGTLVEAFPAKLLGVQTEPPPSTNNSEYIFSLRIPGTPTREVVLPGGIDPVNVGTVNEMSEMPNLTPGIPIQK